MIFFLNHEIFQAFSSLATRSNTSRAVMIAKVNIISTCADSEMHKYYRRINELLVISPEKGEILLQKIDQIVTINKVIANYDSFSCPNLLILTACLFVHCDI
mgnify:FL=1